MDVHGLPTERWPSDDVIGQLAASLPGDDVMDRLTAGSHGNGISGHPTASTDPGDIADSICRGYGSRPDRYDCQRFYQCVPGRRPFHLTCPGDLHYDPRRRVCNWPWALRPLCVSEPQPGALKAKSKLQVANQTCGVPAVRSALTDQDSHRIVGGHDAPAGSWPWMVSLQHPEFGHGCGGALIAEEWVVTAAHCFDGIDWRSLYAVVGEHRLSEEDGTEQAIPIAELIRNDFNWENSTTWHNDIALLRLAAPATLNRWVAPVCLPDSELTLPEGTICVVAGWGNLVEPTGPDDIVSSDVLQEAEVPLVDTRRCDELLPFPITTQVCAGRDEGGVDACQGDSGGPLVCEASDGHWFVYGVTSFGRGCARPATPGVYTNVPAMKHWILQHISAP
ncbi:Enteropeptidase [Branchiostoma belcheri]|nr:Enteropeptidase [Branchiostoma belcheri]